MFFRGLGNTDANQIIAIRRRFGKSYHEAHPERVSLTLSGFIRLQPYHFGSGKSAQKQGVDSGRHFSGLLRCQLIDYEQFSFKNTQKVSTPCQNSKYLIANILWVLGFGATLF